MDNRGPNNFKPIIFWEGFPVCALLLKKVADELGDNLVIVATKAKVPFWGIDKFLGHEIVWLDDPNDIWKRHNEFSDRNFVIHTGWTHRGWLCFDKYLRKLNQAKIVVAVDNRFRGDVRQILGAAYFRLVLKKNFDAAIVPGKSGKKLLKFLGMPEAKVYSPVYGAFEGIYNRKNEITDRRSEFLFVGQLIHRKGVDVLINAFNEYRKKGGTWDLRLCGDGPLRNICSGDGIVCEDFAQPNEVADKMNEAKVLVLPSRDDNWGTVVCEAAACGMHLLASKMVAASEDIIKDGKNGIILDGLSENAILNSFFYFEKLSQESLARGSELSVTIAKQYDSQAYFNAFHKMVKDLF
jgi:glycosyltransferase involved in cell wall biosynthesis